MSLFKEKVNLGVNELWKVAYENFKPYKDRLRSTNATEFIRDTLLDKATEPFKENSSVNKEPFIQDKTLGS
jgi:hypothetical protein